jgi:CRP-like cAMP-binding protein
MRAAPYPKCPALCTEQMAVPPHSATNPLPEINLPSVSLTCRPRLSATRQTAFGRRHPRRDGDDAWCQIGQQLGVGVQTIRNRLLASLSASDLSLLRQHLREAPIEQGQILEERGHPADRVHFPQSGMISLIVAMPEDQAVEVGTVGNEGAIGLMAGLGSRVSSIRALVQVSGTALRLPASSFRAAAGQSQRIRDMIVRYAELELGQVQQSAACNALHDARSRICRWLLQTSDRTDSNLIPFTQEFLGQMLGLRRQTVSLNAARLQSDGLIHTHHGEIHILDRAGLRKEACECYEFIRMHIERLYPRT